METTPLFQLAVSVITILASGFGAYLGVRISITELKGDVKRLDEKMKDIAERVVRLENRT